MIGPMLMGAVSIAFGLLVFSTSNTLALWAANWHWTLRNEQKPAYAAKKQQTIRIGAICFISLGGALIVMGLLTGLISGRWVWSSLAT